MHTIGVFACIFDEQGRVLCVRENYGERLWAMPGGRLEAGEDPISAIEREAMEEAAAAIYVRHLVGVYAATHRDDVVLLFTADLITWSERPPDGEISEVGLFPINALPEPMGANTRLRFGDVAAGCVGVLRSLSSPGFLIEDRNLPRV